MNADGNSVAIGLVEYPAYGSYAECMTRAFFAGLSTFTIVFSGTFFGQRLLKKNTVFSSKKRTILASTLVASVASYYVASKRVTLCRKSWTKNGKD
ncbi:uncharacterized protein LOC124410773 [Diprion similis]|uniref:uncharacterized protein LOC124410773 n=1 Tax=Diprion similis TaxID=362088 RepID=UPI001EF7C666|nr:uncharacterized protein LOC124410773 [Diprion similis]